MARADLEAITGVRNVYGTIEVAPLSNGQSYHDAYRNAETVSWKTPGVKVTRLRLLSDPGYPYWDVSYVHGELNGKPVIVDVPFSQLSKRGMSREIVEYAKKDGVFARGIGILDAISTLN